MKGQTRLGSLVETLVNVTVGYLIAILSQLIIFPLFDIEVSLGQNMIMGLVFMVVSIIRSYLLRRFFDKISRKNFEKSEAIQR